MMIVSNRPSKLPFVRLFKSKLNNRSEITNSPSETEREIELIKSAEQEIFSENRAEILQNKPNPRGFRKFLFPQLTPGGPLGLVARRAIEDRQNWPENERKEI
jgi:hypothetical protein